MMACGDLRTAVAEAGVLVEAAILAANSIAMHRIVESSDFDRLMSSLYKAAKILDNIDAERTSPKDVSFPT